MEFSIYYDSQCPLCKRIKQWIESHENDSIDFLDLSDDDRQFIYISDLKMFGSNIGDAFKIIHGIEWGKKGGLVKGPDVARKVFDILGYNNLCYLINIYPFNKIFNIMFNFVSNNRGRWYERKI